MSCLIAFFSFFCFCFCRAGVKEISSHSALTFFGCDTKKVLSRALALRSSLRMIIIWLYKGVCITNSRIYI